MPSYEARVIDLGQTVEITIHSEPETVLMIPARLMSVMLAPMTADILTDVAEDYQAGQLTGQQTMP